MSPVPPRYSAESVRSVPSYSPEPLVNEQRLEFNPPVARRPIPTGTFTRESKQITLLLTQQEDGAPLPTYGRKGTIRGVVFLKDTEDISTVTLKVPHRRGIILSQRLSPHCFAGRWSPRSYGRRGWNKLCQCHGSNTHCVAK